MGLLLLAAACLLEPLTYTSQTINPTWPRRVHAATKLPCYAISDCVHDVVSIVPYPEEPSCSSKAGSRQQFVRCLGGFPLLAMHPTGL